MSRLVRIYAFLLFAVVSLLFGSSLLLHLAAFLDRRDLIAAFGLTLFRFTVIAAIASMPFVEDSLKWVQQIKKCPKWMWRTALGLGIYVIAMTCLQMFVFPQDPSLNDQTLVLSGFPLGFQAIAICILHSVLWSDTLGREEFARRAGRSVAMVVLIMVVFLAYHAGVFPPRAMRPHTNE